MPAEIAPNIYLIDDNLYSVPEWGAVYLVNEEKKALIDAGPPTSAKIILTALDRLGVKPTAIDYIIATHIHLDHAGGAGTLAEVLPNARVIVHVRGARHLVNPARLVASAAQAQGPEIMARTGEVKPIVEGRVQPVADGDIITLSSAQSLRVLDAPGHAPHELVIQESRHKGVFTGDAVGLSVYDNSILLPSTAPPNFDQELALQTVDRMLALGPSRLYYAHFGTSDRAEADLKAYARLLAEWQGILSRLASVGEFARANEELLAWVGRKLAGVRGTKPALYDYLMQHELPMNITGYVKYYQERYLKTEE